MSFESRLGRLAGPVGVKSYYNFLVIGVLTIGSFGYFAERPLIGQAGGFLICQFLGLT
jgi:hypothetical protein